MSSSHNQAIAYRPEIDGLRAIAVLPVILFHAGFELFSGGYVGVDVFFVISGYLITSIILREMEQGKFSIVHFYERRARRILPALFFVIACCLPFAWIWMLPDELKRFGQSLVAVATFSSNIYFWRNTDYFAPAAEEQPLLHTWSLAVEEQYYVLFPVFLMLCWRFGKSKSFWLTVAVAICSLLLAEWGWRNQPIANFYLLPTRAWELLAGSLIAFVPKESANRAQTYAGVQLLPFSGFLMILYSIFFFDSTTPFPSLYAIVPVLGTVLVIMFSCRKSFIGKILASRVAVGIGLISYSAYLWHQPIFAFLRIDPVSYRSQLELILAVVASLGLALLTWKYIEKPFREKSIPRNTIYIFTGLGIFSCMALGVVALLGDGFPTRAETSYKKVLIADELTRELAQELSCNKIPKLSNWAARCQLKGKMHAELGSVVLWGDSHANQYVPALIKEGLFTEDWTLFRHWWCPTIPSIERLDSPNGKTCDEFNDLILDEILESSKVSSVIIASRWNAFFGEVFDNTTHFSAFHGPKVVYSNHLNVGLAISKFRGLVGKLTEKGIRVIVIGMTPELKTNQKQLSDKLFFQGRDSEVPKKTPLAQMNNLSLANYLKFKEGIKPLEGRCLSIIEPMEALCDSTDCDLISDEGLSLFKDDDHLSYAGATKVVEFHLKSPISPLNQCSPS